MFLILACLIAAAVAAPAVYDQRQDGEFNVLADIQNIMFVVAYPKKLNYIYDLFKNNKRQGNDQLQDRADFQVMDAFVEPNTPYQVEIGAVNERRDAAADGRAVEVVIAGRRSDTEPQTDSDEMKLLGATEQCGPDRERDPVTLTCRLRSQLPIAESEKKIDKKDDKVVSKPIPEVVPS